MHNEEGGANWVSPIFADFAQIATDAAENIYVVGSFTGNQLSYNGTVMGSVGTNTLGSSNIVVAKYSVTGAIMWIKAVGSAGDEFGTGIAVDNSGDVYVTGRYGFGTGNLDFEVGNPSASFNINSKAFVVKLTTNGNYVWHKTIPQGGFNYHSICVDENNVYLATQTNGTQDMNAGGTAFLVSTLNSSYDIILAKYRKDGTFVTAKSFGGCTNTDYARGLEVRNGKLAMFGAFMTGTCTPYIDMNSFIPGAPTVTITSNINTKKDGFVAMYDTNFVCQWAKSIGGADNGDEVWGGAFDNNGNFLVSGQFVGTNTNFNIGGTGTFTTTAGSNTLPDYFYASYGVNSGNCNWVYRGGTASATEVAYDITCDSIGRIWTTGYTNTGSTGNDMFINKHFCSLSSNTVTLLQTNSTANTFTLTAFPGANNALNFSKETCLGQSSTYTVVPSSMNNIKVTMYDVNNNQVNSPNLSMAFTSTNQATYGFKFIVKDTVTNCETMYSYQSAYVNNITSSFLNVIAKPGYNLGPVCQGDAVGLGIAATAMSGPTFNWTANGTFLLSTLATSVIVNPTVTTTYIAYANDGTCQFNGSAATVTVNICTGVNETDNKIGISIYPNPAKDILTIELNNYTNTVLASVYSIDGQLIKDEELLGDNNKISVSDLTSGIYFVIIKNDTKGHTFKFIKE